MEDRASAGTNELSAVAGDVYIPNTESLPGIYRFGLDGDHALAYRTEVIGIDLDADGRHLFEVGTGNNADGCRGLTKVQ